MFKKFSMFFIIIFIISTNVRAEDFNLEGEWYFDETYESQIKGVEKTTNGGFLLHDEWRDIVIEKDGSILNEEDKEYYGADKFEVINIDENTYFIYTDDEYGIYGYLYYEVDKTPVSYELNVDPVLFYQNKIMSGTGTSMEYLLSENTIFLIHDGIYTKGTINKIADNILCIIIKSDMTENESIEKYGFNIGDTLLFLINSSLFNK